MRIDDALNNAAERLAVAGIGDPRREASSLLAFALEQPRAFLIAHPEYDLTDSEQQFFEQVVARREAREPFQYITGRQEFRGLEFAVAPGALIPRPETEILVAAAVEYLQQFNESVFVEAGIGSGCVSVSILHALCDATAVATDLSQLAIQIARQNATRHGVDQRLDLRQTDLLTGIADRSDLIVSNPPYIPDAEIGDLQPEVRDFEPREALAGGPDGLDIIRRLVRDSGHILKNGGVLMMEIGAGQAAAVADLFESDAWGTPEFRKDLQSIPRVVIAAHN